MSAFTWLLFITYQFKSIDALIYEAYGSKDQFHCDTAGSDDSCILYCDPSTIGSEFSCGNAGECYFYCQDDKCMQDGILNASNSNNLYAYSSHNECMRNTQIYSPDAGNANIGMNNIDEKELREMIVYGGSKTQSIHINCIGSDRETCKQIQVYAENTKYLQIIGTSSSIMESAIINCPINSNYHGIPCNIDFSDGGIIKNGIFNTVNGIPKDIMITGTLSGTITITCSNVNGISENIGNSFQNQGDCWITQSPTTDPTKHPSYDPTKQPTQNPTSYPTAVPTVSPITVHPTDNPTLIPTLHPTAVPTRGQTKRPTTNPTKKPTNYPSKDVTKEPTAKTAVTSTSNPIDDDTKYPTNDTTIALTKYPTLNADITKAPKPTVTMTRNTADNQIIIAGKVTDSITTTINTAVNGEQVENTEHSKDSGLSSDSINSSTSNNSFHFADHILDITLLVVGVIILVIITCFLYFTIKNYRISKRNAIENAMKSHQNDKIPTQCPDDKHSADPTIIIYKSENDLNETGKKGQGEITPQLPPNEIAMRSRVRTTSICSDAESIQTAEGVFHDDIYMDDDDIMAGITDAGNDEIVIGNDEEDMNEARHTAMASDDTMGLYGINNSDITLENDHITSDGKLAIVVEEHQEDVQIENDNLEDKLDLEDITMAFDEGPLSIPPTKNIYNGNVIYYGTDT